MQHMVQSYQEHNRHGTVSTSSQPAPSLEPTQECLLYPTASEDEMQQTTNHERYPAHQVSGPRQHHQEHHEQSGSHVGAAQQGLFPEGNDQHPEVKPPATSTQSRAERASPSTSEERSSSSQSAEADVFDDLQRNGRLVRQGDDRSTR